MTRVKTFFLLVLYLLTCKVNYSQNLVINGDFEDVNICDEFKRPCSPAAWFYVNRISPWGYFHLAPILTSSGKHYIRLELANSKFETRGYWESKLRFPLIDGNLYEIGINVAAEASPLNLKDIGVYFTNEFIFSNQDTILQPTNFLDFNGGNVKRLKNNWYRVTKKFSAEAPATTIILGNFSRVSNRQLMTEHPSRDSTLGIFFDLLTITSIQKIAGPGDQRLVDSLYKITKRHTVTDSASVSTDNSSRLKRVDTLFVPSVLFQFGKSTAALTDSLRSLKQQLVDTSIRRIMVIGYTDEVGDTTFNLKLSKQRAEDIKRSLINDFQLDPNKIETQGKGVSRKYKDAGYNRRVEIILYYL